MKKYFPVFLLLLTACTPPNFEKAGGTRLILEARLDENASAEEVKSQMEATKAILVKRLDQFGISNPNVKSGETVNNIIVEVPGKENAQRLRKLLQSSVRLEFWETYENSEMGEKIVKLNTALSLELFPELKDITVEVKKEVKEGMSMDEQFAAQKSEKENEGERNERIRKENPVYELLNPAFRVDESGSPRGYRDGPVVGIAMATDTAKVNSYFKSPAAEKVFGKYTKFLWTAQPKDHTEKDLFELVAIRTNRSGKAAMQGDIIEEAKVIFDDNSGGSPQIYINMNKFAASEWQKMTKENIGKAIAIVIDDQVYSYPTVVNEIPGGAASISGNFTKEEAEDLVSILKSGYLPVSLRIIQEEVVSPK